MTLPSTALISEADYNAIEDALQSSEKGRRFLRAYADRNRSLESRRLLRSISRLHRASFGSPGINAEVCRDLTSALRSVARHRQVAAECSDPAARLSVLTGSLQEVEACLLALIESLEERIFVSLGGGSSSCIEAAGETYSAAQPARLSEEVSPFFSHEPR